MIRSFAFNSKILLIFCNYIINMAILFVKEFFAIVL